MKGGGGKGKGAGGGKHSGGGKRGGGGKGGEKSTPMTSEAASRIQSADARAHGGKVEKGGFAARAQSAAARNEAEGGGGEGSGEGL